MNFLIRAFAFFPLVLLFFFPPPRKQNLMPRRLLPSLQTIQQQNNHNDDDDNNTILDAVQTINQLLTEMDGFDDNTGVIVMAATNRPAALDSALTRPGRFDRMVVVPLPDVQGRAAILAVHCRNKRVEKGVDLSRIARSTAGFTGERDEVFFFSASFLFSLVFPFFIFRGRRKKLTFSF